MANKTHLAILMQGVEFWNNWREENLDIQPDLSNVNLVQAQLGKIDLSKTNLSGTYLIGAELVGADMSEADLTWAVLVASDFH